MPWAGTFRHIVGTELGEAFLNVPRVNYGPFNAPPTAPVYPAHPLGLTHHICSMSIPGWL